MLHSWAVLRGHVVAFDRFANPSRYSLAINNLGHISWKGVFFAGPAGIVLCIVAIYTRVMARFANISAWSLDVAGEAKRMTDVGVDV